MRSLFLLLAVRQLLIIVLHVNPTEANHADIEVDDDFVAAFEETEAVLVESPTDLEFTPDGRFLYITQKEGFVWVVDVEDMDSGEATPKLALEIPVAMCINGERGLSGIAIHPSNQWAYIYYTYDKYNDCSADGIVGQGPINRFSRWTLDEDNTIDAESEVVLFDTPRMPYRAHASGDIAFGNDGYLYVTVGDGGARTRKNDNGVFFPQALDRLVGKIVRLTDDGDIPENNPFTPNQGEFDSVRCNVSGESGNPSTKCQEIYATGLRNPFRFAFDPNAEGTRFFINDVGRKTWERILEGGDSFAGANYGYPFRQGPCEAKQVNDCTMSEFVDPVHWWRHDEEDGGAVTAGAFVPGDIGWPESFDGAYLYADYAFGGIYSITPGGNGCPYPECDPPISDYEPTKKVVSSLKKVVSMQWGPGNRKDLYVATRGNTGNRGLEGIFRVSYKPNGSKHGPEPTIIAEPTVGFSPLAVNFAAALNEDSSEYELKWDFDGDGVTDSEDAKPSFTYSEPGTYDATLTVQDSDGKKNKITVSIEVANHPPIPKIVSPPEGTTFAIGDILSLVGSATDVESDIPITLTWEVWYHHSDHYHKYLDPMEGNDFDLFLAPPPIDFATSTTSHLVVLLTATDSFGLSSKTSVIVKPKMVEIIFDTNPPGLCVIANGEKITSPATIMSWENHEFEIEVPNPQSIGGILYGLNHSWADEGSYTYVASATDRKPIVANFERLSPYADAGKGDMAWVVALIFLFSAALVFFVVWKRRKGSFVRGEEPRKEISLTPTTSFSDSLEMQDLERDESNEAPSEGISIERKETAFSDDDIPPPPPPLPTESAAHLEGWGDQFLESLDYWATTLNTALLDLWTTLTVYESFPETSEREG